MTTTIEGLDELRASLTVAADRLADLSGPAGETGEALAAYGQQAAPVLTGELAGSFGLVVEAAGATVTIGAAHAVPVQFGTRFMEAQPFMPDDMAAIAAPIYTGYLEEVIEAIQAN